MPLIIPFFIMNRGCPNRCIFCNERITAGISPPPLSADLIQRTIQCYLKAGSGKGPSRRPTVKADADIVQIAFYGGNFTGLPLDEQVNLLRLVAPCIASGQVDGIRISTRPDDIDPGGMTVLRELHVKTVEIGAQSLVDEVLSASRRGHSAADVSKAAKILQAQGFEVGLHLMTGLPGDNREYFYQTVDAAIGLGPDMVRIHPTLVFRDTPLAEAFYRGDYRPLTMEEALERCKYAKRRFHEAGIPVIRLGLQSTPEMEKAGAVVAGPYHPAFGSLVASSDFLDQAVALLGRQDWRDQWVTFHVPPRQESAFRGDRNENLRILTERFHLGGIRIAQGEKFYISSS